MAPLPQLADRLGARLYVSVGRLSKALRRQEPGCLPQGEVSALATLEREGPMRLGELATREAVSAPSMSRIVAALVDSGHARRERDPQDGRAALVAITPQGTAVVREAWLTKAAELRRRIERLAPEDRAALRKMIPALEALSSCAE
ncbi:DNA-binding MarR family transcriptional regulator [Amycolatopsis bartoniae]|uniref:MarR family transcriptional regulator n=1 Tax=Amycolatopsis bartoniae TaxID=941986 RepID=A0A8H9IVX9_9PSEU|nr:MarR family transcriptional regulator [Amycolatopsis bartoniae]MBB2939640.1 DNA-binding MarR family transcriptional regulator [Amycolatopsis bartoniae]TVT07845.1 MarR family transcriptional regulator [Amycolatopsis bartoniae]GHF39791.1 MarR family transcriptional regulator [Amycolatopsis bartoniae]